MQAATFPVRCARTNYRHELRTLTYVTLDEANGGIIRNLSREGVAVQSSQIHSAAKLKTFAAALADAAQRTPEGPAARRRLMAVIPGVDKRGFFERRCQGIHSRRVAMTGVATNLPRFRPRSPVWWEW